MCPLLSIVITIVSVVIIVIDSGVSFYAQVKLDKTANNKPSRVIHIRNIPNEVTEAEVIHLGIPFGKVTNVLVLKGKNQVKPNFFNGTTFVQISQKTRDNRL